MKILKNNIQIALAFNSGKIKDVKTEIKVAIIILSFGTLNFNIFNVTKIVISVIIKLSNIIYSMYNIILQ